MISVVIPIPRLGLCIVFPDLAVAETFEVLYSVFAVGDGMIEINGGFGGEHLRLFDIQGRIIADLPVSHGSMQLSCEPGPYLWQLRREQEVKQEGKMLVQ